MENIPNAPYITKAERYGIECPEPVHCPVCGARCETIYAMGSEALGCEHCIDVMDASDWAMEGRE